MATQKLRIKVRRDEFAKWQQVNPILLLAEQGYEIDTRKMKIGNGVDRYLDLPYFGETLETIDGFLTTSKVKLEVNTKFLIRELVTQQDANLFFIDQLIKQEEQIKDIIDGGGLDLNYVQTSGDVMTGTLQMVEEDGYRYNISERRTENNLAGIVSITQGGEVKFESYYVKQDGVYVIDVADPSVPNPLNAIVISSTRVTIGRDLNVLGQLFVGGVNILDAINFNPSLTRDINEKYDKAGGPISGPVTIIPGGVGTQAVFEVNSGGVWSYIEPTDPNHLVTKGYVDREKMPYNISRLRALSSITSFVD